MTQFEQRSWISRGNTRLYSLATPYLWFPLQGSSRPIFVFEVVPSLGVLRDVVLLSDVEIARKPRKRDVVFHAFECVDGVLRARAGLTTEGKKEKKEMSEQALPGASSPQCMANARW